MSSNAFRTWIRSGRVHVDFISRNTGMVFYLRNSLLLILMLILILIRLTFSKLRLSTNLQDHSPNKIGKGQGKKLIPQATHDRQGVILKTELAYITKHNSLV